MTWTNSITRYDPAVDPTGLLDHPDNARVHDEIQRGATERSLRRLGWIDAVVVSERSGRIVDGHERVGKARERGWSVPVLYVDVEPIEEHYVLAHFDALAALATPDEAATAALLERAAPESSGLAALLAARAGPLQLDPPPPDPDDPPPPDPAASGDPDEERPSLADRFGAPPFSVLDASQPYWRAALAEFSDCPPGPDRLDPVLVDLLFRWFSPRGLPVTALGLRCGTVEWTAARYDVECIPEPDPGSCGLGIAGPAVAELDDLGLATAARDLASAVGPDRFIAAILDHPPPESNEHRDPAARLTSGFAAAGVPLYNELVAVASTRPATWRFPASRRLPAGHRTVLVFTTGPGRNAADGCAPIDQES